MQSDSDSDAAAVVPVTVAPAALRLAAGCGRRARTASESTWLRLAEPGNMIFISGPAASARAGQLRDWVRVELGDPGRQAD